MRPLRLEVQGFAAFRERVEIDFEGIGFFALIGPTGSGKSTIIDAICFALYGCVPRYDDNRRVGFVVTTGASQARVSLTFEIDSKRFVATRVVRRKPDGSATTKEARLERYVDQEKTEVLAGTAPEVEAAIVKLLGLPFDHFTKCVVLPQGAFARFLHDKPSERQELLVRLLNLKIYERVGVRARQLHTELSASAAAKEQRLQELGHATDAAKEEAAALLEAREKLREDVAKAKPGIEALEKAKEALTAEAANVRSLVSQARKVTVPTNVIALARRFAEKRLALGEADKASRKNDAEVARLEKEAQSKPKIGPLELALSAHQELDGCRTALSEANDAVQAARESEKKAATKVSSAQKAFDDAKSAAEKSRQAHAAHFLARDLTAGSPCPVCRQVVNTVPKVKPPTAIRDAEGTESRAKVLLQEAHDRRDSALQKRASAETAQEALVQQETKLLKQIAKHPNRGKLEKLVAEVQATEAALGDTRQRGSDLHEEANELRDKIEEIAAKLREFDETFNRQRDALVSLGPPTPKRTDLGADWQALAAWAEKQVPKLTTLAEQTDAEASKKETARHTEIEALRKSGEAAGVRTRAEISLAPLSEAVIAAEIEARSQLKQIVDAIAEAKRLEDEIREVREESEVARTLGNLLSAKGFEQWLVSEALQRLVDGASTTLQQLSGGQYSLRCDEKGEFLVVDHRNADEMRSAKTLSGGETFQASLALALALSDQLAALAANGGASLDAIFLDEGFGTLDADALVIVGDTIEAIGAGERMVGIVTHVKELAERVPVRYVIQKGSRSSTVDRIVA